VCVWGGGKGERESRTSERYVRRACPALPASVRRSVGSRERTRGPEALQLAQVALGGQQVLGRHGAAPRVCQRQNLPRLHGRRRRRRRRRRRALALLVAFAAHHHRLRQDEQAAALPVRLRHANDGEASRLWLGCVFVCVWVGGWFGRRWDRKTATTKKKPPEPAAADPFGRFARLHGSRSTRGRPPAGHPATERAISQAACEHLIAQAGTAREEEAAGSPLVERVCGGEQRFVGGGGWWAPS
jgi:hypothetical protein